MSKNKSSRIIDFMSIRFVKIEVFALHLHLFCTSFNKSLHLFSHFPPPNYKELRGVSRLSHTNVCIKYCSLGFLSVNCDDKVFEPLTQKQSSTLHPSPDETKGLWQSTV